MIEIRVDDFPYTKQEETWRHNLENFKKFDSYFEKYNLSYTLGVIPNHTTEEMREWLSENNRVEVAIHGINHDEKYPNEFREYQTEEEISSLLRNVREQYGRCNSTGEVKKYIPPHNVLDQKTVRALLKAGYETVLCGPGTESSVFSYANKIGLDARYSEPPYLYGRTDEMMKIGCTEIIKNASFWSVPDASAPAKPTVVTLHWTWESNIGYESLDSFLKEIKDI
jgi:hypothetical protein